MIVPIIHRLLTGFKYRVARKIRRSKIFYVALFFVSTWIINALLFYYSEHIIAGREDVDIWASLYWSIITMATIGYGDITPIRGLGWVVAGFAAVMGILAYTLTVSVIADAFLSASIRRALGMAPLKNKKIIVIGDSEVCKELIDELILNGLGDKTGWITPEQPSFEPRVDFMIGDPSKGETLKKGGVDKAKHIVLCISDESKTLHVALLAKKYNKKATFSAVVSSSTMEDILKEAGIHYVVSYRIVGRTLASTVFEPGVAKILNDLISAKGKGDLIEIKISKKEEGMTVGELVRSIQEREHRYRYSVVAVVRGEQYIILPPQNFELTENDSIILIKALH